MNAPLSAETRTVIDAVLEALDIPHAATVGHEATRAKILDDRLLHTVVCLRSLVDDKYPPADLGRALAYLREKLDARPPVGYVTHDQARERVKAGAAWSDAVSLDHNEERGR